MAFNAVRSISLPVASATVIAQRRYVSVDSNGQVVLTAANGVAVGVSLEASAAGDTNAIAVALIDGSIIEVEAGAAVTRGAAVAAAGASADAGRADDTAAAAGVNHLGIALDAATAAGEVIRVLGAKPSLSA